jgi:hypothetical protein
MDNQDGSQSGVRERSTGRYDEEVWGAKDSLRRNAGMNKISTDEVTPLLDSGSGSSEEDSEDRTVTEWAGHADFEGVTWWRKPSVRTKKSIVPESKLISVDVLATGPFLPPHTCHWRHHGPQAQLDFVPCMPRIPDRIQQSRRAPILVIRHVYS